MIRQSKIRNTLLLIPLQATGQQEARSADVQCFVICGDTSGQVCL